MPATLNASSNVLASDVFHVTFDPGNGTIQNLAHSSDQNAVNFVLSAKEAPDFDVEDTRFLGDLIIHATEQGDTVGRTMTTGLSGLTRSISQTDSAFRVHYNGKSGGGGFDGVDVVQEYMLGGRSGDVLVWTIKISNVGSGQLDLEDIGFPLPMNSYWSNDQTNNYERRVNRHSFVALHGSYIYWQSPSGTGPILLLTPGNETSLEYKTRYAEGERFGEDLPKWEGLTEVYIHSKHIERARSANTKQYLPATSRLLAPGQSCTYSLNFRFVENQTKLHDAIFDSGGFDIISYPGMVVPNDTSIMLAVRCEEEVASISSSSPNSTQIIALAGRAGYKLFKLALNLPGENFITITTTECRRVVLQYFSIKPIDQLIAARSAFLARNQLARSDKGFDGAFLQWDMASRTLLTWENYPGGGWREWMVGGSDDLGLAPGAYLSEKCLITPEQEEITALDYHIDKFLFGYLINARDPNGNRTYQVYRWYDGKDTQPNDLGIWRAYNYTHIANLLFNMYRLGKAYPGFEMSRKPMEYLELAYQVVNAMYSKIPLPNPIGDAANTLGLMGESVVPEIIQSLVAEDLHDKAATLQSYVNRKMNYYEEVRYPFASEMTIDTTGFESVYAFAKDARTPTTTNIVEKCQKASIASRGLQPLWYYYGSDNRMMGEAYWNLGYETQLGAWQQQDYLVHFSNQDRADFADSMRSTYGAYLAGWANINTGQIDDHVENIGAASWVWQSEGENHVWSWMPVIGRWWAWSGEADLGFWGALRTASVNVVQDPVIGLYAYGGNVELIDGSYIIEPKDGVRQRLTLFCIDNLTVRIEKARYHKAIVARNGSSIELTLTNVVSTPCAAAVKLINVVDGDYLLSTSLSVTETVITVTNSGSKELTLPSLSSSLSYTVLIRKK